MTMLSTSGSSPLMATFPVRTSGSALVVMVEPAEYRDSLDAALHLRRSSDGLLLGERLVWAGTSVSARWTSTSARRVARRRRR